MKLLYQTLIIPILIVTGCSPSSTNQYDLINQAKWSTSTIEVIWISKEKINDICSSLGASDGNGRGYNACARSKPTNPTVCEIRAIQPINFDDENALKVLGHEVWHCFGAKHM